MDAEIQAWCWPRSLRVNAYREAFAKQKAAGGPSTLSGLTTRGFEFGRIQVAECELSVAVVVNLLKNYVKRLAIRR